MAKQIFGFGNKKTAQDLEQFIKNHGPSIGLERMEKPKNAVGKWVMKALTPISAADYRCTGYQPTPTPGEGLASICYRDLETGQLVEHIPDPGSGERVTATVYSLLSEVIPQGWYFIGTRDLAGTIWAEAAFAQCEGSGGSGAGSGLGSGSGCINIVTDVSFDVATCRLIVCTRNVCFPPGTIIGPEDCGSGGSGG
jgi:hypothetical protein